MECAFMLCVQFVRRPRRGPTGMRNPLTAEQFLENTNAKRLGYMRYRDLWNSVAMEGGGGVTTEGCFE